MMKIKVDFVTNSSSTAYVVVGYEIPTGRRFGSSKDGYYDDSELEGQLAKDFKLPKGFEVFDLHCGRALVGIVLTGYEDFVDHIPISKVINKLDELKEIAEKNGWKDEPEIFGGSRSSE